jgi:hypothetical protein
MNRRRTHRDNAKPNAWTAPEHARDVKGMERDRRGNLIIDVRRPIKLTAYAEQLIASKKSW